MKKKLLEDEQSIAEKLKNVTLLSLVGHQKVLALNDNCRTSK